MDTVCQKVHSIWCSLEAQDTVIIREAKNLEVGGREEEKKNLKSRSKLFNGQKILLPDAAVVLVKMSLPAGKNCLDG